MPNIMKLERNDDYAYLKCITKLILYMFSLSLFFDTMQNPCIREVTFSPVKQYK